MSEILKDVVAFIPTTTSDILTSDVYSMPLKLHINTALSTLVQNGIGVEVNLFEDDDIEWEEFFNTDVLDHPGVSQAMTYVYIKTQLLFDPPQPSHISILEKAAEEALWRARTEFDIDDNT